MKKITILALALFAMSASVFAGGCYSGCCNNSCGFSPYNYPYAYNGSVVYEPVYWDNYRTATYYDNGYVVSEPYYYGYGVYSDQGYIVNEPVWDSSGYYNSPSSSYFYSR